MITILPVSSKGQFTIPFLVRKKLNIIKGSLLKVTLEENKAIIEPFASKNVTQFFGSLPYPPPTKKQIQHGLFYEKNTPS